MILYFIKNKILDNLKNFYNFLKLNFDFENIINFNNIFLIIILFIYIIFFFFKKFFNEFYKNNKIYKYIFMNSIFFLFLIYFLNLKEIFLFWFENIYLYVGNEKLNLLSLIFSLIWIIFTLFLSFYNCYLFELLFKDIEIIDLNFRILFFKFFNSIIFFIILITGFFIMKLDKFLLTFIGGTFGLGLSISLQKIFVNYISGLIILIDKSFKLGDSVFINGYQGVITQISNRYVMLRNFDCSEILIPNEKFINEVIQNQSLYFSKGNLRIMVQISYNNDIKFVLGIMIESTLNIERILENPIPVSYFVGFGINNVDLELSFWISDAVRGAALVKSEVNINIWNKFIKHNIEMPYSRKLIKLLD